MTLNTQVISPTKATPYSSSCTQTPVLQTHKTTIPIPINPTSAIKLSTLCSRFAAPVNCVGALVVVFVGPTKAGLVSNVEAVVVEIPTTTLVLVTFAVETLPEPAAEVKLAVVVSPAVVVLVSEAVLVVVAVCS